MMKNHPFPQTAKVSEAEKGLGGSYKKVSPTKDNSLTMVQNKLEQLRKVQSARQANKELAVASNEKIKEYSAMIEEKETEIMKLMSIVDMLQNSRQQHIKETAEQYDKDHPFDQEEAEITMLRDAEEALSGREKYNMSDYLDKMRGSIVGYADPIPPYTISYDMNKYSDDGTIVVNGGLEDSLSELDKVIGKYTKKK